MLLLEENSKESQHSIHQKKVVLRKDYYVSTIRMKGIWYENVIDLNDAVPVKKQVTDGISVLTLDVTDAMRWAM